MVDIKVINNQKFSEGHLGLYAAYHFDKRNEDDGKNFVGSDGVSCEVSLPEAKTTNATLGVQVIWNLLYKGQ